MPWDKSAPMYTCGMLADSRMKLRVAETAGEVPDALPWFKQYREEYMRMLRFSEHETFDHPVACKLSQPLSCLVLLNMFVCSSNVQYKMVWQLSGPFV